jgi:hypothetical protein
MRLVSLLALLLAVAGCSPADNNPADHPTVESPAASNADIPAEPAYAGTYAVQDTAICALVIGITKRGSSYFFSSEGVTGKVSVSQEGSETYFTFVGLKGEQPSEDISAVWQDSVLLIQNYGNSMNEYTRFGGCDAKYLELRRQ